MDERALGRSPVWRSVRGSWVLALWIGTGGSSLSAVEPRWTLDVSGRTYTYTLTLSSPLPASVLLDTLFEARHVQAFSRSSGRLTLLRQEGAVQEVRFDCRRLFYRFSSVFRRTLNRESAAIEIQMLSFTANWAQLAPLPLASRARYTVVDRGESREIEYQQVVETDRPVAGLSLYLVRKSLRRFGQDLDEYLQGLYQPKTDRDRGDGVR